MKRTFGYELIANIRTSIYFLFISLYPVGITARTKKYIDSKEKTNQIEQRCDKKHTIASIGCPGLTPPLYGSLAKLAILAFSINTSGNILQTSQRFLNTNLRQKISFGQETRLQSS